MHGSVVAISDDTSFTQEVMMTLAILFLRSYLIAMYSV